MSDTPETNSRAWSDHNEGILHEVVEANFARKLERERDEAIRQRNETNESSVFSCNFYYEEKLKAERERNEIQEKYDNLATEHMLVVNKLCEERDEARDDAEHWQELYKTVSPY